MSGGPSPPVHSRACPARSSGDPQATTSAPRRLARSRRPAIGSTDSTRAPRWTAATSVARPIGPAPNTTTCSPGPEPAAGQRVHGHRGGLDEARAVRVQVADPEDQAGRDLEPFGQAAVEVHADQAERRADVGPPGAARVAAAARQQGQDRDPLARGRLAVPRVVHDRGHLVPLDPRVEVAAPGQRAHVTGKQVEVGAADTHPFGSHDNVTGPGAARSGNVPHHHLAG